MKKIVVDTSVFVSALLCSKSCRHIYELLKEDRFRLVISKNLLTELKNVLTLAKFEFTKEEIDELTEHISRKAQKVESTAKIDICRDPKDNIVLECAAAGKADFIVTEDNDLLSLKSFRKIRIITPRKFLEIFS